MDTQPKPQPPLAASLTDLPPAQDTPAANVAPTVVAELPKAAKPDNPAGRKPIFAIVLSMVFFVALCAVAYYAYSKSN